MFTINFTITFSLILGIAKYILIRMLKNLSFKLANTVVITVFTHLKIFFKTYL